LIFDSGFLVVKTAKSSFFALFAPAPSQDQENSKENQWKINGILAGWEVQNLSGHWSPGWLGSPKPLRPLKILEKSINSIKSLRDFFISFIKPSETFSFSYKIFQILALGLLGSGSAGSGPAGPTWVPKTLKKH